MKTDTHFWQYLAQLFLEWEMLHTKIVEKIKTLFMFGTFFFSENHGFCDIIWIFFLRAGETTDENMAQELVTQGN